MPQNQPYKTVNYNPFTTAEIVKVVPSTEPQKEIYVAVLLGGEPASLAYNESVTLQFNQALNAAWLTQCFQLLINRHEALRSTISKNGEQIIIYRNLPFQLNLVETPPTSHSEVLEKLAHHEVNTPFDLNNGPLFRATLATNSNGQSALLITGHHLVFDGWSIGVLLQELSACYTALANNQEPNLPSAPQISDYAREEFAYHRSSEYQQTKQFWTEQFSHTNRFVFYTDNPTSSQKTYQSTRLDFNIDEQLTAQIKTVGAKLGLSLASTLMAVFEVLLSKINENDEVLLGLPTAGQLATNKQNLMGHCVNMLPLKSHVNTGLSLAEHLQLRHKQLLEAYEHQRFTFGTLMKATTWQRDGARTTPLPVVFNVDIGYDNGVSFAGIPHQLVSNPRSFESFDIFLNISGNNNHLNAEWSYNTQLYNESTIKRFHEQYLALLQALLDNPNALIKTLSLDAKSALPIAANAVDDKKYKPLGHLISQAAAKYPDRIAISTAEQKIGYAEMEQKTNAFAQLLMAKGVQVGHKVGLAVNRSADMVIALVGILKCGACYLPLDPNYPAERLQYILDDGGAQHLIVSANGLQLQNSAQQLVLEELINELDTVDTTVSLPQFSANELLYILHTSGSTGKPKGVQITHRNVVNLLLSVKKSFDIKPDDKMLAFTTIAFDIAEVEILLPLISGAEVMVAPTEAQRDAEQLLHLLDTQNISYMQATPSGWQMLLDAGWDKKYNLNILCAGEPMSLHLAQNLLQRCSVLWNAYGPTETTIYSTTNQIHPTDEVISIGKPVSNTQIYILDTHLQPVPQGEVGEIYIAGDGVSKGYINKPQLTAQRYLPNPFATGSNNIMYRTGDLGRFMPDGKIQCLGRIDHQVKIRGYRIELEEIEQSLLAQPDVQKAVVTAIEIQPGNQQLVAYIIPQNYQAKHSYKNEIKAWRMALQKTLPAYMIPSFFMPMERFPLTPNGKTDRNALPNPVAADTPAAPTFAAADTFAEKEILQIWQQALGRTEISVTDNFFELGGHSLLAVQVMQKIEAKMGVKLPLATLFEHTSIRQLAQLVSADKPEIKWNSLVKIKSEGNKTPLYLIHGSGLNVLMFYPMARYMDEQQPVYGLQAQGLDGNLPTFTTIEEIASAYVNEIVADRPNGPYAFVGYSLGGIIALEMAKQLQKNGQEVTFLGVVDTYISNASYQKSALVNLTDKVLRQPKKLLFFSGQFIKNPAVTVNYQLSHLKALYNNIFNARKITQQKPLEDIINDIYMDAYMRYELTPHEQRPIHLFKVRERIYYIDEPKYLGWKPYAPKGLKVTYINGDHATFLLPPNDKSSAEIIQKKLDEAESTK